MILNILPFFIFISPCVFAAAAGFRQRRRRISFRRCRHFADIFAIARHDTPCRSLHARRFVILLRQMLAIRS